MLISVISEKASLFPYEDVVVPFNIYLATGVLSSLVKLCICTLVSCRAFGSWFLSHVNKSLAEYLKLVASANTLTTATMFV